MLVDSNIIIYAAQPEHGDLRQLTAQHSPAVSAVSYVEVLELHRLSAQDRARFEAFFAATTVVPITEQARDKRIAREELGKL